MDLIADGTGTSINAGNGGPDVRDKSKVTIAMDTHIDTPRPSLPHQMFSNQELIDAQCKDRLYFVLWAIIYSFISNSLDLLFCYRHSTFITA